MTFLGFMKQIGLWDFEGLQQDWIKIQSALPGFQKNVLFANDYLDSKRNSMYKTRFI